MCRTFKYVEYGRDNVLVLDKVVHVHMSNTTAWVTTVYKDIESIEMSRSNGERLIKALNDD